MAAESSPAFQFYVKEWRSSRAVMRMTFAQRGMYLEMLLEQWEHFALPDDPAAVAELLGGTEAEWVEAWPVLRRKFVVFEDRRSRPRGEPHDTMGRIQNLRMERVRKELVRFRKVAHRGGIARSKSATRRTDGSYLPAGTPAGQPAVIQPPASTASATATATPTATATAGSTRSARGRASGGMSAEQAIRFDAFWTAYPKKVAKEAAVNAWRTLDPSPDLCARMAATLTWQIASAKWTEDAGRFIPYPATWLNQKRFQDEPTAAAVSPLSDVSRGNVAALDSLLERMGVAK